MENGRRDAVLLQLPLAPGQTFFHRKRRNRAMRGEGAKAGSAAMRSIWARICSGEHDAAIAPSAHCSRIELPQTKCSARLNLY